MSDQFMQIGLPANITISNEFGHVRIIRRWFHSKYIFFTFFTIVWDGFLIFLYVTRIRSLLSGDLGAIEILLFSFFHLVAGIVLTYYTLAGYLNKTIIDVDFDSLTIKNGPLPSPGNKIIPSRTLRQLYVKVDGYYHSRDVMTYGVHAIMDDQRDIELVGWLDAREQALYIEQEIEKALHIEDKPVEGEVRYV